MNPRKILATTLLATAALASAAVWAQGGPPVGRGPGSEHGRGMRFGADNTPGWGMMTPAERGAHHKQMQSMKSYDDCKAHMEQHHMQMSERAKQQGRAMPGPARRDGCAWLNKSAK